MINHVVHKYNQVLFCTLLKIIDKIIFEKVFQHRKKKENLLTWNSFPNTFDIKFFLKLIKRNTKITSFTDESNDNSNCHFCKQVTYGTIEICNEITFHIDILEIVNNVQIQTSTWAYQGKVMLSHRFAKLKAMKRWEKSQ